MKKTSQLRRLLGIIVILAVAAFAQTTLAATTVDNYQFSQDSVSASWSSSDSCAYYSFDLSASVYESKNNAPYAQAGHIYINTVNWCTGISAMGYSEGNPAWFQLVVGGTKTASLKGNFPVQWTAWQTNGYGYYNFGGNAAVDLQWTGNGTPQRSTNTSREHSVNFTSTTRNSGVSVTATPAGSITLDGNPCPATDAYGAISTSVYGTMTIMRSGGKPPATP